MTRSVDALNIPRGLPFAVIRDERVVSLNEFATTPVEDGSVVSIAPLVGGG